MPSWQTPQQVAESLGVDDGKILAWIKSGELLATNVAVSVMSRPRWRISPADLQAFLKERQSRPASPMQKRRKQRPEVKKYF